MNFTVSYFSMSEHKHAEHSSFAHNLLLAGGISTATVVAAPYLGNIFSLGKTVDELMMPTFHCASGWAASVNGIIGNLPIIGGYLAAGGIGTAIAAGIIGIGGMLLGNYIQKNYDADSSIPWGKIIKYTCLATSMLIALPSLLTGLSVGFSYLASFTPFATGINSILVETLGSMGMAGMHGSAAAAGLGSLLTHFFTCGGAALSAVGAAFLDNKEQPSTHYHAPDEHLLLSPRQFQMEVASCSPIIKGEKCQIGFRLLDENGNIISANALRETHTKKLHVMIVDASLADYHHLHPEYDKKTSMFIATFTPRIQNSYNAWHDFELTSGEHFILKSLLPAKQSYKINPQIQHNSTVEFDSLSTTIEASPPLTNGKKSVVHINMRDAAGNPAKFEEIMGASAHLVGFSKDGNEYIHCHPIENLSHDGKLVFHIAPNHNGFSKFFLGIKTDGVEKTIPFGQYIKEPSLAEDNGLPVTNRQSTASVTFIN